MSKHTQGEWHTGTDPRTIQAANGTIICNVICGLTNPSVQGDIALIAAAPDLLSSNRRLLLSYRALLAGKPVRDADEVMAEAETAIRKATGPDQ